jgi:hypothetical protein
MVGHNPITLCHVATFSLYYNQSLILPMIKHQLNFLLMVSTLQTVVLLFCDGQGLLEILSWVNRGTLEASQMENWVVKQAIQDPDIEAMMRVRLSFFTSVSLLTIFRL